MVDILKFINKKLTGIPYEYGEWTGEVSYPYFVGSFTEDDYRFEDGHTGGTLTIDGWSRKSKLELLQYADEIKDTFSDLIEVDENYAFAIRYGAMQEIPSGEADLFRVTITLFTDEWKGEN